MSEPLSAEELREMVNRHLKGIRLSESDENLRAYEDRGKLLTEVARLRAELAECADEQMQRVNALDEERRSLLLANRRQRGLLATWRWLVQAVAELDVTRARCNFPQCDYPRDQAIEPNADHAPDCPVTLARAALEAE